MLGSNRDLTLFLSALAVAACLLAVGIVVVVDRLVDAGGPVSVRTVSAER
jgi:hypothetical protein